MGIGCPNTCDAIVNGTCQCPPGCSGFDDWYFWEDSCQVNESLRLGIHVYCLVSAVLVQFMAITGMIILSRQKYSVWWQLKECFRKVQTTIPGSTRHLVARNSPVESFELSAYPNSAFVSSELSNDEEEEDEEAVVVDEGKDKDAEAGSKITKEYSTQVLTGMAIRQIKLQNILSTGLLLCFLVFGVAETVYESLMLAGVRRYSDEGASASVLNFSVALGSTAIVLGLWAIAYKWYDSLPSLKKYGRVFQVQAFLIRYPDFFYYWCQVCSVLSCLGLFMTFFIMPQVKPENRKMYDHLGMVIMTGVIYLWVLSMIFLAYMLDSIYSKPFKKIGKEIQFNEKNTLWTEFKRLRCIFVTTVTLAALGGACATLFTLGSIFSKPIQMNFYISWGIVSGVGSGTALIFMYIVIFLRRKVI